MSFYNRIIHFKEVVSYILFAGEWSDFNSKVNFDDLFEYRLITALNFSFGLCK